MTLKSALTNEGHLIILLHGIAMGPWHMSLLASRLRWHGYEAMALGYPSTRQTVAKSAYNLKNEIAKLAAKAKVLHLVGHSMGGLVIRNLLSYWQPPNMGRVVNLGTPHYGSEVADYFWRYNWFRELYGPAGDSLRTTFPKNGHGPLPINYELASIAGTKGFSPWRHLLQQPNDGTVSAASTRVEGSKAYYNVPSSHFGLPFSRQVSWLTANFLFFGKLNSSIG